MPSHSVTQYIVKLLSDQCCQGAKILAAKHKRAGKKLAGLGKSGVELLPDLSKKGSKGAEFFSSLVFHKIIFFSCSKDFTCELVCLSFLTTLDLEPLKKL
jgi:hypothetical protein